MPFTVTYKVGNDPATHTEFVTQDEAKCIAVQLILREVSFHAKDEMAEEIHENDLMAILKHVRDGHFDEAINTWNRVAQTVSITYSYERTNNSALPRSALVMEARKMLRDLAKPVIVGRCTLMRAITNLLEHTESEQEKHKIRVLYHKLSALNGPYVEIVDTNGTPEDS